MPHYIWRKLRERFNSEYLQTSVKHTISPVVVLGSASGGGGNVIKIDEKMNTGSSEKYHQTTTLPMQYRKFLKRKTHSGTISVMEWPPQSPDLKCDFVVSS